LLSVTTGTNLRESNFHDGLSEASPEAQEALKIALEGLNQHFHEHLTRKLQATLPPPFEPTRACGEIITVTKAAEMKALVDLYLSALFPPGSPQEAYAALARTVLFPSAKYDIKSAKVCMTCAEAAALLEADLVNNAEHQYGFQNYCADSIPGADQVSWHYNKIPYSRKSRLVHTPLFAKRFLFSLRHSVLWRLSLLIQKQVKYHPGLSVV
jgi:hypothetical protein